MTIFVLSLNLVAKTRQSSWQEFLLGRSTIKYQQTCWSQWVVSTFFINPLACFPVCQFKSAETPAMISFRNLASNRLNGSFPDFSNMNSLSSVWVNASVLNGTDFTLHVPFSPFALMKVDIVYLIGILATMISTQQMFQIGSQPYHRSPLCTCFLYSKHI